MKAFVIGLFSFNPPFFTLLQSSQMRKCDGGNSLLVSVPIKKIS